MPPIVSYSLVCFGSLFSIVDPFAAVPIFLALAGNQPKDALRATALRASLTCFTVLTTFGLAGATIFTFFGITVAGFKVAGGILLFAVALDMVRARSSSTRSTTEERDEAATKEDVGLIPIGLPLLSGPGAIATVMVLAGKATTIAERISVHIAVVAVSIMTFFVLRWSGFVARVLGRTGLNVIGRIMGLILAALAVQFIIDGAREALPGLAAVR